MKKFKTLDEMIIEQNNRIKKERKFKLFGTFILISLFLSLGIIW